MLSHCLFLREFVVRLRDTPCARHNIEWDTSNDFVELLHRVAVVKKNLGAAKRHATKGR